MMPGSLVLPRPLKDSPEPWLFWRRYSLFVSIHVRFNPGVEVLNVKHWFGVAADWREGALACQSVEATKGPAKILRGFLTGE